MKNQLKRLFAAAGYHLEKIPRDVPGGRDLAHDLGVIFRGRRGAVCLDVGAHDGQFTELLLRALEAPAIHAFEPAPDPFGRLRARYGSNPAVTLMNAGLSDAPGRLSFNIYDNQALNSFLPMTEGQGYAFSGIKLLERREVEVIRIDDYAARAGLAQIDLLKIDTQGFERQVLRGASRLLASGRVHAVLAELDFVSLYSGQVWGHELIAELFAQNLHLVDLYEKCRLEPFLGWCTALFVRREPLPSS